MKNKIVIVVPCYNEAIRFNSDYFNELIKIPDTIWLFINDGSTDDTGEILQKYSQKQNTIYLTNKINLGKSKTLVRGFQYAFRQYGASAWVGFLDSDGAFHVSDVQRLIKHTSSKKLIAYNAVYSSRVKMAGRIIKRKPIRHVISRLITTIFGLIWLDIPYDTQSGFKLYRSTNEFKLLFLQSFKTRWFFDIELSIKYAKYHKTNLKVWEDPVFSWVDIKGSKINLKESVRLSFEILYIFFLLISTRNHLQNRIDPLITIQQPKLIQSGN